MADHSQRLHPFCDNAQANPLDILSRLLLQMTLPQGNLRCRAILGTLSHPPGEAAIDPRRAHPTASRVHDATPTTVHCYNREVRKREDYGCKTKRIG